MDNQNHFYAAIAAMSAIISVLVRSVEALIGKTLYAKDDNHFKKDDRIKINEMYIWFLSNKHDLERLLSKHDNN